MRAIKLKIGTFQVPETYQELTLRTYLNLEHNWDGDPVKGMAYVLNVPYKELFSSGDSHKDIEKVFQALLASPKLDLKKLASQVPETYELQGETFRIRPITRQTLGQKVYFEQLGAGLKDKNDLSRLIGAVCAIYLTPQYFKQDFFTVEDAEKLNKLFLEEPFIKVYPLAAFFLRSCRTSILNGLKGSKKAARDSLASNRQPGQALKLLFS